MPLLNKSILSWYSPFGLLRFLISNRFKPNADNPKIQCNEFSPLIVSDSPMPKEMAAVISGQAKDDDKIQLLQDEVFFNWRYRNDRNKYVFYYFQNDGKIAAYIVIRLSKNGCRGYICDYAAEETRLIEDILTFVIREKHFDVISIYNLNLSCELYGILIKTGFRDKSLLRRIEKKVTGEWPLLVRPVKRAIAETDWLIGDIDLRSIGSWEIKEICSDSS
jgi:hypothetical protein